MRPLAVFRFSPTEGPGYLGQWLDRQRLDWQLVAIDGGEAVPGDPRAFAGIALMGGPMGVNDDLPWIEPVLALLRAAVDARVPVLGHCLGGQLLAKALGAPVTRAASPEIGWLDVATTDAAARDAWFGGRATFTIFQWHYDTFALPRGAVRVLANGHTAEQGFVVDDRHLGLQGHVEMTPDLVATWLATGSAELPAVSRPGIQCAADIRAALGERMAGLNAVADAVYTRWAVGLARD